jgi:hypothetical protein
LAFWAGRRLTGGVAVPKSRGSVVLKPASRSRVS